MTTLAFPAVSPVAPRWWWRLAALLLMSLWGAGCASVPSQVAKTTSHAFAAPEETALGKLAQARRAQAKAKAESAFTLLDDVDAAFSARLALIDAAQRTLDLQYYAIHADSSTEVLLQHLQRAAQRGVRVRILLDAFNSVGEDAQVLRLAFARGIEMRLFNPTAGPRGSLVTHLLGSLHQADRLQKRMHNKLFLADSAWGITGGRNLGDAYFGGDEKSAFVDLDVLAAGPIVQQMAASFDRYWNDPLAYPVQSILSQRDIQQLQERGEDKAAENRKTGDGPPAAVLPTVAASEAAAARRPPLDLQRVPLTWAPGILLVDEPRKIGAADDDATAGETVVDGLLQLMQAAKREIVIVSPYFVPGPQMMGVFADLRRRGVQVRVLTNSLASTDAPAAHAGYRRYRKDLLALGVEIHEMRSDPREAGLDPDRSARRKESAKGASGLGSGAGVGGSKSGTSRASLHSKAVVIDRQLAVIGSMNLDLRSQLKNSEVALVIRSTPLATAAAQTVERSFGKGSYHLQLKDGDLVWKAPPGAGYGDSRNEPEAGFKRKLLLELVAPFAPDEML
jgi:phosphatidylserine/phosphatidylglycerophosphate/cardiolipin synthase-like enzyme